MDIVYPYHAAKSGWLGNELRFSLRSLEKHFKEDFRVWVIGDLPEWATHSINHIPFDRFTVPKGPAFSNNANIAKKIAMACRMFDRFMVIADDQYLLKDAAGSFFERPFYSDYLKDRPQKCSKWQARLWDTVDRLQELGMPTLNAECHTPFLVDSKKFIDLENVFSFENGTHLWKTAYLNFWYRETAPKRVPKRSESFSISERQYWSRESDAVFLCHNDAGLTDNLKCFLMDRFNRPSKFEKFAPAVNKIFGVGMPKTGTNSLTQALRDFGYTARHYPRRPMEMDTADAATDLPVANNFERLDMEYKNSKFILTVRDDDSWRTSAMQHFASSNKSRMAFDHRKKMFNAEMPNEQQLMAGKERHEKKVLMYFKDRPEDLLVLNIFNGEGYWEIACFLGRPEWPEKDFPHLNKRQERAA